MPLVPSYIQNLENYVPGKPINEVQREMGISEVIKLASNENSLGPSPRAMAAMRQAMEKIHRYPDASGYILRKKLAEKFDIKIDNVVLGAGSEGIMSTIIRTFLLSDDEIISAKNSFIGFRVLANTSGKKIHWIPMKDYRYDLNAMAEKINDYTKLIYIANPDNPMGTYITREEFDSFYQHVPERVLIILDEAYFEFSQSTSDYPDSMTYRYDNVITLRTFSKAYGLAGARIGYGFAHEELIGNLEVMLTAEQLKEAQEMKAELAETYGSYPSMLRREAWKKSLKFTGTHIKGYIPPFLRIRLNSGMEVTGHEVRKQVDNFIYNYEFDFGQGEVTLDEIELIEVDEEQ